MKLAIIGTGGIVAEALVALESVPEIKKAAVFARPHSREKAEKLAKDYGIGKVYTDYDELLKESDADFVYIGLINSAHFGYAKKALQNGKNVILEKPFTPTRREAKELADLATQRGLYLFEAVTILHMENYKKIKELLPRLGKIRMAQANYSQYSSRYDKYLAGNVLPAFSPEQAGGALYDINIYNLNFLVSLLGKPKEVSYAANIGFNGIDTSGAAIMRYDDFTAVSVGAKDSDSPGFITIQGEKGYLRVVGAPNQLPAFEFCAGGEPEQMNFNEPGHRMIAEFKEFAKVFAAGDYETMSKWLTTSLDVMETAEKARKSAGIKFPTDDKTED